MPTYYRRRDSVTVTTLQTASLPNCLKLLSEIFNCTGGRKLGCLVATCHISQMEHSCGIPADCLQCFSVDFQIMSVVGYVILTHTHTQTHRRGCRLLAGDCISLKHKEKVKPQHHTVFPICPSTVQFSAFPVPVSDHNFMTWPRLTSKREERKHNLMLLKFGVIPYSHNMLPTIIIVS